MENYGLVIITNGNYFAHLILERLFQNYSSHIRGVLIISGDYKARTGLRALWAVGTKTALPYLFYKIFLHMVFTFAQSVFKKGIFNVEALALKYNIPVHTVPGVNSDEALNWVSSKSPDLLVSVSCPQMIKRKMLALARKGGINIHSSLLPAYAGLAPYFWVLSNGEKYTGTTVHYMTLKFDEGNILAQRCVEIIPGESAFHLFKRLAELGSEIIVEGVEKALNMDPGVKQDLSKYTYYSNPTFGSYVALRKHGHCLLKLREVIDVIRNA